MIVNRMSSHNRVYLMFIQTMYMYISVYNYVIIIMCTLSCIILYNIISA